MKNLTINPEDFINKYMNMVKDAPILNNKKFLVDIVNLNTGTVFKDCSWDVQNNDNCISHFGFNFYFRTIKSVDQIPYAKNIDILKDIAKTAKKNDFEILSIKYINEDIEKYSFVEKCIICFPLLSKDFDKKSSEIIKSPKLFLDNIINVLNKTKDGAYSFDMDDRLNMFCHLFPKINDKYYIAKGQTVTSIIEDNVIDVENKADLIDRFISIGKKNEIIEKILNCNSYIELKNYLQSEKPSVNKYFRIIYSGIEKLGPVLSLKNKIILNLISNLTNNEKYYGNFNELSLINIEKEFNEIVKLGSSNSSIIEETFADIFNREEKRKDIDIPDLEKDI